MLEQIITAMQPRKIATVVLRGKLKIISFEISSER